MAQTPAPRGPMGGGPRGPMGGGPRGPMRGMMKAPKIENAGKIFARLLGFVMKHYGVAYIAVILCIFVSVFASIQGTLFTRTLIDGYITPLLTQENPDFSGLLHAILRVACFYGLGIVAGLTQSIIMMYIAQGVMKRLRNTMFAHMQKLPIKYFDTHAHGDIMSLYTNDIDTLRQMVSQSIPQMVNSVITVVSVFTSMVLLNIPLTLLTLVMVGVMLFAAKKLTGLSGKNFIAQQKNLGMVNGYIEEMMEGQKVVKVFCHEKQSLAEFTEMNNNLFDSAYNANKLRI